ncbi:hypothetical protein [Citrobacter amalonaticus]|uniref:hypothetical protein n=1 Tax=Citrobacter amalonaticus TaxID=35703 RepID=UPI001C9451B1|nr:hypothetical protein [Citrobacter amalonaticus]
MTTENQHSAPDYAGAHRGMFCSWVCLGLHGLITHENFGSNPEHSTTKHFSRISG